jgi:hypothetical protein
MLNFPGDMSTVGFNSEPAMVQWNALHFTTPTLETFDQRHLRFQTDVTFVEGFLMDETFT